MSEVLTHILTYLQSGEGSEKKVKKAVDIAAATFPLFRQDLGATYTHWKDPFNPESKYPIALNISDIQKFVDKKDPLEVWRFLPEKYPSVLQYAVGPLSNHSLYDLLFLSLAVYNSLKSDDVPSFLLFTFGPVQGFIRNARKTSDLWAGSYLLSYLTFRVMLPILEELGPYHVIFPHLLRQPLVDAWLNENLKHGSIIKLEPDTLSVANLPNRFLAVVPYNQRKSLIQKIEEGFKSALSEISRKVLDNIDGIIEENEVSQTIQKHLTTYFQKYWVVVPWTDSKSDPDSPGALKPVIEDYSKLLNIGKGDGGNELPHAYRTVMALKDREGANVGLAYPLLYDITERFLGARKSVRDFQGIEQGENRNKCSICGEYDPLPLRWEDLHTRRPGLVKENEKLCGVCLTKRVFPYIAKDLRYLSDLRGDIRFPSTSDMATAFYKKRISDSKAKSIKDTLQNSPLNKVVGNSISPPCLKEHPLYSIDGQWLFRESYRSQYLKHEFELDLEEEDLKDLWEKVKGHLPENRTSPTYYAILMMDGDSMGKWLSGEHDGIPKFSEILLGTNLPQEIGDLKHPVSPVLHGLFSRLLGKFALEKVRYNVESCTCGKLVYAGGDDVLAILPANTVLEAAYRLRNTFRDAVSPKADMSAGVVFVHHKYPLSLALDEVRDAERKAKTVYERAALYVKFIKRGGEVREFGLKWEDEYCKFQQLVGLYHNGQLPSGFGYDFLRVITELGIDKESRVSKDLEDILLNELYRMVKRKVGKVSEETMEVLKGLLKFYAGDNSENERNERNENRIYHFANALIVANILAKEDIHD